VQRGRVAGEIHRSIRIRDAMTPSEAWETYVGSDSTSEYDADSISEYVWNSPLCDGLDDDEREALAELLRRHIEESNNP